jgi:hypothetical protein
LAGNRLIDLSDHALRAPPRRRRATISPRSLNAKTRSSCLDRAASAKFLCRLFADSPNIVRRLGRANLPGDRQIDRSRPQRHRRSEILAPASICRLL